MRADRSEAFGGEPECEPLRKSNHQQQSTMSSYSGSISGVAGMSRGSRGSVVGAHEV
jgi:hypothetical protein